MPATKDEPPPRSPTSREINLAIDTLNRADADPDAMRLLSIWNAHRLVNRAQQISTYEELANLFTGLPPTRHGTDRNNSR